MSITPGYTSSLNFGPYGNYGTMQTGGGSGGGSAWGGGAGWGVAGAGIGAAGQLYGAIQASNAANEATRAQLQSTEQALAFQREQEAIRKANFERAFAQWMALRSALTSRYGLSPESVGGLIAR